MKSKKRKVYVPVIILKLSCCSFESRGLALLSSVFVDGWLRLTNDAFQAVVAFDFPWNQCPSKARWIPLDFMWKSFWREIAMGSYMGAKLSHCLWAFNSKLQYWLGKLHLVYLDEFIEFSISQWKSIFWLRSAVNSVMKAIGFSKSTSPTQLLRKQIIWSDRVNYH